nr:MAG TPA: hypothetical protein [Caudoviricetes sp.]
MVGRERGRLFSSYLFYFERVFYLMIEITKSEAKAVRKVFPHACIAKTRHKRYLEESVRYLELLPFNIAAVEMLKQMQRNARY